MSTIQLPFPELMPESSWTMPTEFPDLVGRGAKFIGLDVETCDQKLNEKGPGFIRKDAFVAGYSVYTDDGFNKYFPVRHAQGRNLPPNIVADWLREQLGTDIPKHVANGLYDLEACWHEDITDIRGEIQDVQVAEPLIDEETAEGYSLEVLSKKYLGEGKEEELLKQAASLYSRGGKSKGRGNIPFHPKKDLWLMDPLYVGPYAEGDSIKTSLILQKQLKILGSQDLLSIWRLETSLIPILLRMRIKGVGVDVEGARALAQDLTKSIDVLAMDVKNLVGIDLNVDSGPQIRLAYEEYNRKNWDHRVEIRFTAAGNPSFVKEWLEVQDDPLSKLILKKRKLMTMRDDFVLGDILGQQVDGRVHAQFHQLRQDDRGTRSGRFSSTNPNLQQVPARDEEWAPKIRGLFIADEGSLGFLKADVSQQEPRLLVHFANLCRLPGAAEAVAQFLANPLTDYHDYTKDVCNAHSSKTFTRKGIKAVNLGIMYAMGLLKLCRQIGVSQHEGREILSEYHAALPFVKLLSNKCSAVAAERGFIRTILGRLRRFNLWEPVPETREEKEHKYARGLPREQAEARWPSRRLQRFATHKALNSLIQGSAADQIKESMRILYYEHGLVPHLQVHDELGASVGDLDEARIYKRTMQEAVLLTIPVVVDARLGPSWGSAHEEVSLAS